MKRLILLTKLLVLLSLILAMLPAGATETVCVVGAKKQVVAMRKCGMPCCAHKPQVENPKAACCKPKAEPREACPANLGCHCETRYAATNASAQVVVAKLALGEVGQAVLDSPSLAKSETLAAFEDAAVLCQDIDPPRKVPRTPMRGRAPPVTSP